MSERNMDHIWTPEKGFTNGDSLVFDERMRQCAKGFSREHDDKLRKGKLVCAARKMLTGVLNSCGKKRLWMSRNGNDRYLCADHAIEKYRRHPIQLLIVSAAMICAEIERRERIAIAAKRRRARR